MFATIYQNKYRTFNNKYVLLYTTKELAERYTKGLKGVEIFEVSPARFNLEYCAIDHKFPAVWVESHTIDA